MATQRDRGFSELPHRTEDLIIKLDEMFPVKGIDQFSNTDEAWYYAGQRHIVSVLLQALQRRNPDAIYNKAKI